MEDQVNFIPDGERIEFKGFAAEIKRPDPPISEICIGKCENGYYSLTIGVNKKFNWFQKKMIKWCFGFDVKENK
jgi:hypothetical protein